MIKKCLIIFTLLLFATFMVFSNLLFLGEVVHATTSGKSSGEILKVVNIPFNNYSGIYKQFDSDYNYKKLIEKYNLKLVCVESLNGVTNYYYYSKKLPKEETIKGKKVNLQIAISSETVVIGTPIIYGSY